MLSLLEKSQPSNKALVFGGNINTTLIKWLKQLGVNDFVHAAIVARSIDKAEMQKTAEYIRNTYGHMDIIFSVGLFADKILFNAGLEHGILPATNNKNLKEIDTQLIACRNYLIRRMYNA